MDNTQEVTVATDVKIERKTYTTPQLTEFGSFAEITQGGFANVGADNGIYS